MDTKITKDLAFPFIACPAATFFADFVQFQGENHPQAGSGVIFTADSYSFFMEPRPKIFGQKGWSWLWRSVYGLLSFHPFLPSAKTSCHQTLPVACDDEHVITNLWSDAWDKAPLYGAFFLSFFFFRKIDEANWCMVQSCLSYPSLEETSFALRRPCLWEVCTGNFSSKGLGMSTTDLGDIFLMVVCNDPSVWGLFAWERPQPAPVDLATPAVAATTSRRFLCWATWCPRSSSRWGTDGLEFT